MLRFKGHGILYPLTGGQPLSSQTMCDILGFLMSDIIVKNNFRGYCILGDNFVY